MNCFKANVGELLRDRVERIFFNFFSSPERLDTILKCDGNGIEFTRLGGCTAGYF